MTDIQNKRLEEQSTPVLAETEKGFNPSEVSASVAQNLVSMETAVGVREKLGGMEGSEINEKDRTVSEKKADPVSTQNQGQSSAPATTGPAPVAIPVVPPATQPVMVRTVKGALIQEIEMVQKEVKRFQKHAVRFAHELAEAFQKLRNLKSLLRDILMFAADFLKMLYEKVMKKETLAAVEYVASL